MTILLLDDHTMFLQGVGRLLQVQHGITVLPAPTVAEGLAILASSKVDVAVVDYDLGEEVGLDFIEAATRAGFAGRVLVLTAGVTDVQLSQLLQVPVAGLVLKNRPIAELARFIYDVAAGIDCWDPSFVSAVIRAADASTRLDDRERQVLALILEGASNKDIAGRLNISEAQVKSAAQKLFHKTGARTRAQLVRLALERPRLLK